MKITRREIQIGTSLFAKAHSLNKAISYLRDCLKPYYPEDREQFLAYLDEQTQAIRSAHSGECKIGNCETCLRSSNVLKVIACLRAIDG